MRMARGTACAMIAVMTGCNAPGLSVKASSELNAWCARAAGEAAVRNAILTQHTLYDYHFVRNSPRLNGLGYRDLAVLADHLRQYPGELNVRRGNVTAALHQERIETVIAALSRAGVATDQTSVSDGLPGGEGIPSERVVVILQQKEEPVYGGSTAETPSAAGTGVQP